jgi:hypothetical protein
LSEVFNNAPDEDGSHNIEPEMRLYLPKINDEQLKVKTIFRRFRKVDVFIQIDLFPLWWGTTDVCAGLEIGIGGFFQGGKMMKSNWCIG